MKFTEPLCENMPHGIGFWQSFQVLSPQLVLNVLQRVQVSQHCVKILGSLVEVGLNLLPHQNLQASSSDVRVPGISVLYCNVSEKNMKEGSTREKRRTSAYIVTVLTNVQLQPIHISHLIRGCQAWYAYQELRLPPLPPVPRLLYLIQAGHRREWDT